RRPPGSPLFPYTTLFRSLVSRVAGPPIVLSWLLPSERRSHSGGSDQLPGPTAPPIDVPQQPPLDLPPIDARPRFDAKVLLRGGRSEEHTAELQSRSGIVW